MRLSSLHLLVILLFISCSRSKNSPYLFTHLEEKAQSDLGVAQRAVANVDGTKCLKDVFSVDLLKAEIKELEKKFSSGTKLSGRWKHLNFADLPIPQANFLKTYGDKIGDLNNPSAFDYSGCKDVPCLFNKIYGKDDQVAGYVHYLWYLKMGNLLAATNNVYQSKSQTKPGIYNGKTFAVSSYLYRDKELYGFWRLLMMMRGPHTNLASFTEIHRVPQGESFDFEVEERAKGGGGLGETCGLAYSSGVVILQDLCLGLYDDWENGNFYESILHEFSHQVDYDEGRKLRKTYRSSEQDYLDVSYFYLKEYKDESNQTVRQWEHKEGIKLVSSYSGTSPAENFAETVSYFRVDGSKTKSSISSDHWDFVSKNYYANKSFEKKKLMEQWITAKSSSLAQASFKAVSECSNSSKAYASTYFNKSDFVTSLVPSMIHCLGAKAQEASVDLMSQIKVNDPDGCKVLTASDAIGVWNPLIKKELLMAMEKYLMELKSDANYFAKIQGFIDEIPDRGMASRAYLGCASPEGEVSCYQDSVMKLALEKLAPLNLPAGHSDDLAKLYLNGHPFDETKQYLRGYYKSFVASHKAQITTEALEVWTKCTAGSPHDEATPSGTKFSLGDGYLVSSIYNCLNSEFSEAVRLIVQNLSVGDITVQHPKEEMILSEEVAPELQKGLMNIYLEMRESERDAVSDYIATDKGKLRSEIAADFTWVKDVLSSSALVRDCQKLALSKIQFPVLYETRGIAFSRLVEQSCKNIQESPEYNTWLDQSKSIFKDKSVVGLENRILELAKMKAKSCLVQYPVDTNVNRLKFKVDRENCLLGEWKQIEGTSIQEFETDPLVVKFKIDVSAVKLQLEVNRRRQQLKVMKEFF
jgi:hypothetical protein